MSNYERRVNDKVNYVNLKAVTKKNFYAIGTDSKGKSFLGTFENVTKLQAKNAASQWARKNKLTFEGVYAN